MSTVLTAPAKLNLCLYLGEVRDDGLHRLASVFEPLELADRLVVTDAVADLVITEGVDGPDLAERALAALREWGWDHPPLQIEVQKQIPVAAGLGGGSADAAAVLRLAAAEVPADELAAIGASLGADIPSQIAPRPCLVAGAGELVEPIATLAPHAIVLVPSTPGLATADVYREADQLGLAREPAALAAVHQRLRAEFGAGEDLSPHGAEALSGPDDAAEATPGARAPVDPLDLIDLLVNDLQPAALSLRPEIGKVLNALAEAGAAHAMITGSGPTAVGLFAAPGAAHLAAHTLERRFGTAIVTASLQGFG